MKKKSQNIGSKIAPIIAVGLLLVIWQAAHMFDVLPKYMLPSPMDVIKAFWEDFPLLMNHAWVTLGEAFAGLAIAIVLGFGVAMLMNFNRLIYSSFYPILIITQTIPTVAIAPLLVLWLGYGVAPKITLVVITGFFPIVISLLEGFSSIDEDALRLMRAMGAGKMAIFRHVMIPGSMWHFFSGLKISVSYSIVGAVISEWLGGFLGLGVYMTRVKKSFSYDKMFAVIFLISFLSLILMWLLGKIQQIAMPYAKNKK